MKKLKLNKLTLLRLATGSTEEVWPGEPRSRNCPPQPLAPTFTSCMEQLATFEQSCVAICSGQSCCTCPPGC